MKIFCIFLLMIFMSGCGSYLYHPDNIMYVKKELLEPVPQELHFDFKSLHIHGWYFESRKPGNICVNFFHGNAQNRSSHFQHLFWLVDHNIDYYIWDYPGYGDVEGSPSPKNTVQAAIGAIRFVHNRKCSKHVVYGHSLGGQIAMRAVWELRDELNIDLIVFDSTFHSYQNVGMKVLQKSWLTWVFSPLSYLLLSDEWSMDERKLKDLQKIDKLFIHSKVDRVIPFELGTKAFNLSSGNKELWVLEYAKHNGIYFGQEGLMLKKKLLHRLKKH